MEIVMSKKEKKREKVFFSEVDAYLFGQGTHYEIYKKLGAHLSEEDGKNGTSYDKTRGRRCLYCFCTGREGK